ncbi:MAG TPA: glycosyltransferase, partial [Candidatus Nitrosocosmicus sp.]|nr:glycosyltransferase [Candidatus Nitrosocosmicus sp.]
MKIIYFTDTFLPQINGVVTSLITISSKIATKHDVTIIAPQPAASNTVTWKNPNIKLKLIHSVPSLIYDDFRISIPLSPRIFEHIKTLNPDLIHFQTSFFIGGSGILLAKIFKKPVIGTFHGYFMEPEYLQIIGLKKNIRLITESLWKYAVFFYNQCDVVLTPAESAKKDLLKHGVKKEIVVIPNSIPEEKIKKVSIEDVQKLKEKYKLKSKVILYVGRVSPEKYIDVLVKS